MTGTPAAARHRHSWWRWQQLEADGSVTRTERCSQCHAVKDEARSRRGSTARSYGTRAELKAARTYGGTKVGHMGGPVDVQGKDFDTQVRTKRRAAPSEWVKAIDAMPGPRIPRLLIRFVQAGHAPDDWMVFRAADFLDWFGKDE